MNATTLAQWCRKELAHIDLHAPGHDRAPDDGTLTNEAPTVSQHRGIREVEADSVAIGAAHGMPTDQYTIPYVSGWASSVRGSSPAEIVKATAERVHKAAVTILGRLETLQVPDGKPAEPRQGQEHGPEAAATTRRRTPRRTPQSDGSAQRANVDRADGPQL